MYIEKILIRDIPPISEAISLDCDERVNLLIGPNASGKSTIIRAVEYAYSRNKKNPVHWIIQESAYDDFYEEKEPDCRITVSDGCLNHDIALADDYKACRGTLLSSVPVLSIPATRINLPMIPEIGLELPLLRRSIEAERFPLDFIFETDPGIFNGTDVILAVDTYRKLMVEKTSVQFEIDKVLTVVHAAVRKICTEIILGVGPHTYLEPDRISHPNMGFQTSDSDGGESVYLGALSSGTQGTLLWTYALALKIANHYEWKEGWESEPAILLIDEIENHLHPTWQRRVIPTLLEHFPKLQIFATTHSPFVVAGLKAGQVHLLKRDLNGVVTADTNTEDIVGWTMDEVLRALMGVADPTDDETARGAEKLRGLRDQEPLSDERGEHQRQQEIDKLRRQVNRELLAGGPAAADREEFEQQFAEALQRYQESQSLDQDSG